MSEVNEQNPVEDSSVRSGPGRRLREARESRKLTLQQAATQLRMQVRIIEALENDDYSTLPGSTFVQGYLRSYARLLGLHEESILGLAQADGIVEPSLVSSISEGPAEVSSRDLPFRMISFLILLLVVVGLGWWLSQRELATPSMVPEVVPPGGEQGLWLPEEALQQQGGIDTLSTQQEGEVAAEMHTDEKLAVEGTEETTDVVEIEQPVADQPPAAEQPPVAESPTATVTDAETVLTAEMPQSLLELEFQADSWSEISDAAGRKLAYGLIPAGNKLKLRGEAPFKVFLGYATGVTVYYNGSLYDHTPYQRGDVARFRIGRAEHNRPVSGN